MKLLSSAKILVDNLFVCKRKSREGRTKTQQTWDFAGPYWVFCCEEYKATLRVNQVEAACFADNADEILLSGIKSKRQIKTKMVE